MDEKDSTAKKNKKDKVIENISRVNSADDSSNDLWLKKFRAHWWLVIIAIIITFMASNLNDVSIYESMKRCFYAGVIFWIFAEIIDFIVKNKE